MSSNKYLKNAILTSMHVTPVVTNNPTQYAQRRRQYFDPETRAFTQQIAQYSSDFVEAQVQGLNQADPLKWGTYRIRIADVVRPSSAIQRRFDDYKMILFESRNIEYVPLGTKIVTMGSTWLATNPINVSGSSGTGVVRRCNAVWNFLDYYGNVISEPIIVENQRANANDSDAQQSLLISKGYFNVICQYNDYTRQIDTNTRLILGTGAYRVTGYSDFETEFTGDYDSLRLLYFTIRYEEPNAAIDDMENHVAGGKTFSWQVYINAPSSLKVGTSAALTAQSIRNGSDYYASEKTVSYAWASNNEDILTVDANGVVTAIAEGETTITATLEQNPNYSASVTISVPASQNSVEFTSIIPQMLNAYESIEITAIYFESGVETAEQLTWTFSNADIDMYKATVSNNTAVITCYGYSPNPLYITVNYGDYTAQAQIILQGI